MVVWNPQANKVFNQLGKLLEAAAYLLLEREVSLALEVGLIKVPIKIYLLSMWMMMRT